MTRCGETATYLQQHEGGSALVEEWGQRSASRLHQPRQIQIERSLSLAQILKFKWTLVGSVARVVGGGGALGLFSEQHPSTSQDRRDMIQTVVAGLAGVARRSLDVQRRPRTELLKARRCQRTIGTP